MNFLVLATTAILAAGVAALPQQPGDDGRYYGGDDGRYYGGDDGRYIPDNSGTYVYDGSGAYIHDNSGAYLHDDSGAYRHVDDPYRHDDDPYRHQGGANARGNQGAATQNNPQFPDNQGGQGNPGANPCAPALLNSKNFRILKLEENTGENSYHYLYETENKIEAEETGRLGSIPPTGQEAIRADGYFQYVGPDCRVYRVDYKSNENGFQPVGEHLPTPPPIPAAILKALAYNGVVLRKK